MNLRRVLAYGCAGLLAVALIGAIGGWVWLQRSAAPLHGRAALPQLGAEVSVRFDAWARPYVSARSLEDALAAQGWLHAAHRAWQMELLRRAGRGRLAEVLGPGQLDTDRELWTVGVPQLGERLQANAGAALSRAVDAYVAGVNAYLAEHPPAPEFRLAGFEPAPWRAADVFGIGAVMAFQSARNYRNELLRAALIDGADADTAALLMPDDTTAEARYALPPLPTAALLSRAERLDPAHNPQMPRLGFGSNGWVVAPAKSADGHALFAFDSHDELGLPNLFYEVHLFFGEGEAAEQIRGWSVPGLPGVINGYNARIAWGFTNIGDTQDLFLETEHPERPGVFASGDAWETARRETAQIPVRGRAEPEQVEILHTRHGPLISREPPIALAWTAHRPEALSLDALLDLNRAQDWAAFNAALDRLAAPSLNATYADVDGHIGFRTAGLLPQRGAGEGLLPLDGADPANDWLGTVPSEQMPRRLDPQAGFLAAANARVNAPGDGPLVSADNATMDRIRRIGDVLMAKPQIGLEDMQALQADPRNNRAQRVLPALLARLDEAALDEDTLDGATRAAAQTLRDWAPQPDDAPDQLAPLIFNRWYLLLAEQVFTARLGAERAAQLLRNHYVLDHAMDRLLLGASGSGDHGAPGAITSAQLVSSLAEAVKRARADGARWGEVHRVTLQHPLGSEAAPLAWLFDRGPRVMAGGASSVGRANYRYHRPFAVYQGATVRVVARMSQPIAAQAVMPGGQSGHPLSPHYADQFEPWVAGELLPVAATPEAVDGTMLTLHPAAPSAATPPGTLP